MQHLASVTERILQVADGSNQQAAASESRGHEAYPVSFLRPPEAVWEP
ncbi:2-keto-4-pentenoate hydratase/2-oxohepta-3-ene-1,7-dioic acid hydratase in catechol pathway [Paenibacillus sp. 4624]